jgi:hypothetical protein
MGAVVAQRTLVKSLPEVWAQLSETGQLAELLDRTFGSVRVTRLVAEETIDWESDLARGRVKLEPSGFGTRVRLTAELAETIPAAPPPPPAPDPAPRGLLARLLRRRSPPAPAPAPQPPPLPVPAIAPASAEGALVALLDEVSVPRHRPFSRDAGVNAQIA